jgi:hypothetical protein
LSCPFEQSMWSVAHMVNTTMPSHDSPFNDDFARAQQGRMLARNANATGIVSAAFRKGAFRGKNIYIDGDSLSKQLFISLGCLLWSSSSVADYHLYYRGLPERLIKGYKRRLPNLILAGEGSYFTRGTFTIKGGGGGGGVVQ